MSGLIQSRLRVICKNLHQSTSKSKRESSQKKNGGPAAKISKQVSADITSFHENLVTELNSSTSKGGGPADIKQLMEKTVGHRNHLRSVGDNSILKTYTKFAECDFMVSILHIN